MAFFAGFKLSFRTDLFPPVFLSFAGVAFMGIFLAFFMAVFLATVLVFIATFRRGGDMNSTFDLMRLGDRRRSGVFASSSSRRPAVHAAAIFANFAFEEDLTDLFGEPSIGMG